MFGGIEVAWRMEGQGQEVLNVTASSRMDYNFRECYIVSSEGFRKVETSHASKHTYDPALCRHNISRFVVFGG